MMFKETTATESSPLGPDTRLFTAILGLVSEAADVKGSESFSCLIAVISC